ncbi:hypothetical protein KY285_023936 [Solanum tuberosum]|nr:hypothetical protein KY289_024276 [Solanum tuberosum]KAH0676135.1 hypothetical protein KY285_023936 [Solanum tuberosum]
MSLTLLLIQTLPLILIPPSYPYYSTSARSTQRCTLNSCRTGELPEGRSLQDSGTRANPLYPLLVLSP